MFDVSQMVPDVDGVINVHRGNHIKSFDRFSVGDMDRWSSEREAQRAFFVMRRYVSDRGGAVWVESESGSGLVEGGNVWVEEQLRPWYNEDDDDLDEDGNRPPMGCGQRWWQGVEGSVNGLYDPDYRILPKVVIRLGRDEFYPELPTERCGGF